MIMMMMVVVVVMMMMLACLLVCLPMYLFEGFPICLIRIVHESAQVSSVIT
jgi:type IV secretory pathway VirB3-like protein